MKYLVISDIHGSRSAAMIVPQQYETLQTDAILCLGDILYHGPRNNLPDDYAPKDVIAILNPLSEHIIAVRGNCEAEVDQMVLKFCVTSDVNQFILGTRKVFMSHGHIYSPDHLPYLEKGDIFLSGHTHIPTAYEKDGIYLLNPGSPALPKQSHPKTYGILTDDDFTVLKTDGSTYMHIAF